MDRCLRLEGIDLETLKTILEDKLPGFRWWPWSGERREISLEYFRSVDNNVFTILGVDNNLFYLPLVIRGDKPQYLPDERIITLDGRYIYEAEFDQEYLQMLHDNPDIVLEDYYRLMGRPVKVEPLSLETTNVLARHYLEGGDSIVVKGYRLIPAVNMEPLMLSKLTRERFKHIPKLYFIAKLRDRTVSIITGYIHGIGDGGYPFYLACKKYFTGDRSSGLRLGLASKLGAIIADLHFRLNKPTDRGFFGIEPITGKDVELWIKRIMNRYDIVMKRLDKLLSETDKKREYMKTDYWRQLMEEKGGKILEYAIKYMELYRGRNKARIHQDLHLAQMIYVEDRDKFIITDFEGEPGRSDEERVMKEPPLRDLATMIRSLQYLSFMTYMEVRRLNIHTAARHLVRNDATWNWRMRHSLSMSISYIAATGTTYLHGIEWSDLMERFNDYLLPWLIERALYEIYYESKYRPEWIPIPIIGFINPSIPAYKQV